LTGDRRGLIALTGGPSGPLDRALPAGQEIGAARLDRWPRCFRIASMSSLQRHGLDEERRIEPRTD
jgi:DNA polymerase-3 subunit alpha